MILVAGFVLAALTVPLLGGSFERVSSVRFRSPWALCSAFFAQGVAGLATGLDEGVAAAVHVTSYVVLGGFLVANRHIPGLRLVALGTALNAAAIVANGGVMPASRDALETAGIEAEVEGFRNSDVVDDARLALLGDVFAVPSWVPLANVFSIGDVVVVVGAGLGLHRVTASRLVTWRDRGAPPLP